MKRYDVGDETHPVAAYLTIAFLVIAFVVGVAGLLYHYYPPQPIQRNGHVSEMP